MASGRVLGVGVQHHRVGRVVVERVDEQRLTGLHLDAGADGEPRQLDERAVTAAMARDGEVADLAGFGGRLEPADALRQRGVRGAVHDGHLEVGPEVGNAQP